jgi:hypothetical protein
MLHALPGCDIVSSFAGRRKKTAFDLWKSFDKITSVFSTFSRDQSAFLRQMQVCIGGDMLYFCTETIVDSARKYIFTNKNRSMDNKPPTQADLLQLHRYVWGQTLIRSPFIPYPNTHSWQKSAAHG